MNCECFTRINAKLKEAGNNYQLVPRLMFDDKMQLEAFPVIETAWIDPPKRSKKKPPPIICTYVQWDEDDDPDLHKAAGLEVQRLNQTKWEAV